MKKLKCTSCKECWYVNEIDEEKVSYCPYCAEKISRKREIVVDSFNNALLKVICMEGKEILRDKNRLIAYLSDLAPEYKKETRIFSKFCDSDLLEMFYLSSEGDGVPHKQTIGRARQFLLDEEGLQELWVDIIVNALVYALGWESTAESQSIQKQSYDYGSQSISERKREAEQRIVQVGQVVHGGTVVATGNNTHGQCNVELWDDIVSVCCRSDVTVGLRSSGTVVTAGVRYPNINLWKDVISISCGDGYIVGLKSNGKLVAEGENIHGQSKVTEWEDIVSVSCGNSHTVGLKKDGTVAATGWNSYGQCDVRDWKDIVSITCGDNHTVGIRKDGTVIAAGWNSYGQCEVNAWNDIISVICRGYCTIGLKKDRTVAATGWNEYGQCNVQGWENIASLCCGSFHTVGVRIDGTVVAAGSNEFGQCNVQDWSGIVRVACGRNYTVGLRNDGRVISTRTGDRIRNFEDIIFISSGDEHIVGLKKPDIVSGSD